MTKHMDMKQGSYVINALVGDLGAMGYKRIAMKSDQEVAMRAL